MLQSSRKRKNAQIAATLAQTRQRRLSQVPVTFRFKVRNEKRNKKAGVFEFLNGCFLEGKWLWNSMIAQTDEDIMGKAKVRKLSQFTQKEFETVVHKDKDGNDITSELKYLRSSMRDAIITQQKRAVKGLKKLKDNGHKVGRLKFKTRLEQIELKQYNITHYISGPNSYHIQGLDNDIRVAGLRQLRKLDADGIEYEMSNARMLNEGTDYFIIQTIYVDKEIWNEYKTGKKNKRIKEIVEKEGSACLHDINAVDLGCMNTATDAYGNTWNTQVEESERLKKLQRKLNRQQKAAGYEIKSNGKKRIKSSNNQWRTRKLIRQEYAKLSRIKDRAAIELVRDVLDKNVTVIMQDEDLDGWQAGGHGKKVQHGILGRVKTRLKRSEQVHTINQWVPTTKLCTNCGKKWDKIKQYNREFVCPHCKHNGGDRDAHASRTMVWLYQNLRDRIGLDGAEYTREDFYDALREMFPDDVVEGFESSLLDS